MDIFLEEHKNFLLLMLKHKVSFMLIGGYAVVYYGYQRGTGDMDIWLLPDNQNKLKFIDVLREHGVQESKGIAHRSKTQQNKFPDCRTWINLC